MDLQSALEELTSFDHRASALLRRDHEVILAAFRQYREAAPSDASPRGAIAQRIGALLELHDRVEHSVVYPALAPYYAPLIRAFLTEHEQINECIAVLRETDNDAPAIASTLDRLERLARDHIAQEEVSLLAAVEREQPGLNARLYTAIVQEKERLTGAIEDLESRS